MMVMESQVQSLKFQKHCSSNCYEIGSSVPRFNLPKKACEIYLIGKPCYEFFQIPCNTLIICFVVHFNVYGLFKVPSLRGYK